MTPEKDPINMSHPWGGRQSEWTRCPGVPAARQLLVDPEAGHSGSFKRDYMISLYKVIMGEPLSEADPGR